MATAEQVKALIRSHADGDEERFYAIAMQVAAQAARSGHGRFAVELRELVDKAKARASVVTLKRGARPTPVVQPTGELAGLLSAAFPKTRLSHMVLDASTRARLERVLLEQRQRERLTSHGYSPLRKLLFLGVPGTGKTMTASALAGELGLPLFTILLDGLITKFMGETAAKLRLVFEAVANTRGVYLFDEFDALGTDRAAKNDVGEVRRILNSFLQFLEQDESESLIIGATNHPALLDHALYRRFDDVIEYSLPPPALVLEIIKSRTTLLSTERVEWPAVAHAAETLSHAELTKACDQAAKDTILSNSTILTTSALVAALDERRAASRKGGSARDEGP